MKNSPVSFPLSSIVSHRRIQEGGNRRRPELGKHRFMYMHRVAYVQNITTSGIL